MLVRAGGNEAYSSLRVLSRMAVQHSSFTVVSATTTHLPQKKPFHTWIRLGLGGMWLLKKRGWSREEASQVPSPAVIPLSSRVVHVIPSSAIPVSEAKLISRGSLSKSSRYFGCRYFTHDLKSTDFDPRASGVVEISTQS